jgi:hypothetical protein
VIVYDSIAGTTDNNAVRAYARLRRAPEYTAPKLCRWVSGVVEWGVAWPVSIHAWRRAANL